MATRTVYTATVSIPAYASWKCEHCGEVNFSTGIITCKGQDSTSSWRTSKNDEARSNASRQAEGKWKENAYNIISEPNHNAQAVRNDLHLPHTRCAKCGKKPKWNKNMNYLAILGIAFPVALISGILAFSSDTSIAAWVIFIVSLVAIVSAFVSEPRYKKMMAGAATEAISVIPATRF